MKKIILSLIFFCLIFSIFCTFCFATEVQTQESVSASQSVFTRIWEYFEEHSEEIFSYAVDFVVIVIVAIMTSWFKRTGFKLVASVSKCATETTQSSVVQGLNSIIEELIAERNENAQLKEMITCLKKEITNVHTETRAIFDSINSVWGNSKNLPQGIKELLALTYSSCLKKEEESGRGEIGNSES